MKHNSGVLAINNGNLGHIVSTISRRNYSKDSKDCCKVIDQKAGKKMTEWPKSEQADPPPTAWRPECPGYPQPTNYDPYKIKVPDIVVPPLPPSNAKPMLDCAKTKGPCSVLPPPPPPPCPVPPPKPFPWIYVWAVGSFFTIMGLIYRFYLWKEERDRVSDSKPIWRPRRIIKRPFHEKDLPACVQYLIIGTGAAGWAAYRAIQEHDKKAKVFFVTKEDILPYARPAMSKHMWWNAEPPDLSHLHYVQDGKRYTLYMSLCKNFMDPVKFYRKKTGPAVSIASGWTVSRVDADDHVAYVRTMCGEQPIYYERALIATGSKAKNLDLFCSAPKPVRDKVSVLRTIRDLELSYRRVKEAKHVTIVGGGVLGCELAWHLGRMNEVVERPPETPPIEFVHMYKGKGVLSNIVPEYLGQWAAEKIRCEGVTMMPQTQIHDAFITPDNRLELTLSNGSSLVTDYVLVAIGSTPRVEMAGRSFLETDSINGGFKVNTELEARTHLYVAGDVASIYSQWKDTRIRMEHYDNAEEQGYIAGANMTGYWTPANMEPHYWLKLGEALRVEVVGEVGACMPIVALFKPCEEAEELPQAHEGAGDRICFKQSETYEHKYKRGLLFYLRDETVVGFTFWNMPPIDDRKMVATELLRAKPSYKEINLLAELLGFHDTKCEYPKAADLVEIGPCIKNWRVF
ncbi:apoptosis-inducing factor 1, mitochondrial [Amyelois transitella]|uniref:apoptosis-inducing factor 1, mitochondrial n=1 Tax=Amyelois transitella TaxID=680683 RepID=UPI00298F4903|nr:apoptosis-inducing factor 1, mitochondrial [Amyelois transitella]